MISGFDNTQITLDVDAGAGDWPLVKLDGRALHSRRNPVDEARRWAEMVLAERQPAEQDIVLVFGGGWGWHTVALRELWKGDLYVHEPIEALRPDAAPGPARPWEPGPAPYFTFDDVQDEYKLANSLRADVTVHLLILPVYKRMFDERFQTFRNLIGQLVRETSLYHFTAKERGSEWGDHSFSNAPDFLPAYGVGEFDEAFEGTPIFVVAAGPSLDKNVKVLAEARRRGLVIAVNHALKAMHRGGVKPHLVSALEGRNVLGHFDVPAEYFERQILATAAHPDLFTLPFGTRWLVHILEDPVAHRMMEVLGDRGLVGAGGSVATMSFGLANRMGGSPIVLVGQDLAFTEGRAYASGASRDDMRIVGGGSNGEVAEMVRSKDEMDVPEEAEVVADPITLYECKGWHGGTVMTGQSLASQRNWIERAIRVIGDARRIINATEGGAYIEGAEHRRLEDVVADLPVRDDIEARLERSPRDINERRRTLQRFASSRTRELSTAIRLLRDGERQALEAHKASPARFDRAVERFGKTDRRVAKIMRKLPEVDAYLSVHGRGTRIQEMSEPELDELSATYGRIKDAAEIVRDRYEDLSRRLAADTAGEQEVIG